MKPNQIAIIMEPSPLEGVAERVAAISWRLGQVGVPCAVSNILDVRAILNQGGNLKNGQEIGALILSSADGGWLKEILAFDPTFPILAVISGRGNFREEHRIYTMSLEHPNLQLVLDCLDGDEARRRGLLWMLSPDTYKSLAIEQGAHQLQPA